MDNQKGTMLPFLALLKKHIVGALDESLSKAVVKTDPKNDKVFFSYLKLLLDKVAEVGAYLKSLPKFDEVIGKFHTEISKDIQTVAKENEFQVKLIGKETLDNGFFIMVERLDTLLEKIDDMKDIGAKGSSTSEIMGGKLDEVKKAVQAVKLEIPKLQRVEVSNPVEFPIKEFTNAIDDVNKSIKALKLNVSIPESKPVEFPQFPTTISLSDLPAIVEAIRLLQDEIASLPERIPQSKFPRLMQAEITAMPPMKYPIPPTNININPLRGYANSRKVTVGTSAVSLPGTPVAHRRSLIIFNNSASTVYIGGSDVTTINGLPVPKNTYSPPIDAGPRMIVYAIAASGGLDVRVFEVSNDNVGSE